MTYQGFTKDYPATFIVEPYCLKMFKQRWYVLAYSPGIDQTYLYSLDRIHAIELTTQKYKLPKGFNAEAYFKDAYGMADLSYEPVEVKISVSAKQVPYLRSLPLHKSQEEIETNEEYSIFRYFIIPSYDFKQELYKYGSDVEVLAPKSMRKEFAEDAAKTNEMYNH
jgi:predicted DNA-binding transcriptional regulator YafY